MKRPLGLYTLASIAGAAMMVLSIQAGCAGNDSESSGGTGGGTGATGGGAGQAGTGGGGASGSAGTGGSSNCPVGQSSTVANIADGTTGTGIQVDVKGSIVTTQKLFVSFSKTSFKCIWGMFVMDPSAPRGTMVIAYGDPAPDGSTDASACPVGTDAIPNDIKPGDTVDFVGTTTSFGNSNCPTLPAQVQVNVCSLTRTGTGAAPTPVSVSANDLTTGASQYQGMLVKLENVDAEDWPDAGGTVGPFGVIKIANSTLEVHDKFYYALQGAPEFPDGQHFTSIVGINHLDYCLWVLQPRDRCTDFNPQSTGCL